MTAEPSDLKQLDSAEFRTSRLLSEGGFRHAFFTRNGGASTGEFRSLNFSVGVGDCPEHVEENLARASKVLGVRSERLLFLSQVHGRETQVARGGEERQSVVLWKGDALVGLDSAVAVGVRIADCVPILVGDRESGAALAVHAGWRGLVAGVIRTAVTTLRRATGVEGNLVAAIGPHITTAAFEVSPEIAAELARCSPDPNVVDSRLGPKPHVSLGRIARAQLRDAGLVDSAIDDVPGCTFGDEGSWFSYRRDGARSGRHLAGIVPRVRGIRA